MMRVTWGDDGVRIGRRRRIPWSEVLRIGYVTEDTGLAITDDHFLAVQTSDQVVLLSLSAPGAIALSKHLEERFACRYGPKGDLSHSTWNDSVIVRPHCVFAPASVRQSV